VPDTDDDPNEHALFDKVTGLVAKPVENLGNAGLGTAKATGGVSLLVARAVGLIPINFFASRGKTLAWQNLTYQMVRVGVQAIPVVSLVVFAIGAILSLQIVPILTAYGAQDEVANIIAIAMFRELGPLVGAIVLTGFAGASIAAEIGTMTVSEEIEAMETHAIDPVQFLVVPRIVATAIMTVCLAVVANIVGCLGGLVVTVGIQDLSIESYISRTLDAITMRDFFTGLFKAFVFGTIISGLACWLGLSVRGGAQGVGEATTRTVVLTIVALAVVDLGFTWIFFAVGL
jgi:phospholipid/cholesterol/gamma-HCH transport system permease protein